MATKILSWGATLSILLMISVGTGCGGRKPAVSDDLAALAAKSDSASQHIEILTPMAYGESRSVRYGRHPKYRAIPFSGRAGDPVEVAVRGQPGDDPVAWLLDATFAVVTFNDDCAAGTLDACLSSTLPADGSYYVLLREYDYRDATFEVDLRGPGCAPRSCPDGYHYDDGACACVENTECGGPTGATCAPGKRCADYPRDGCDPEAGDLDCPGGCVPEVDCRTLGCGEGQYCTFCWWVWACIDEGTMC